ncbi:MULTISPECIES: hypothetical protein [Dyella]|uniref:Uncharacterized protein n=2 Tax=Dyella TaxID=231454 RepID=A0A4R0YDI5_9GAMM|nr:MULTISPECIES: hypothetical protein [Dyella]TBR36077.1 hypothetical protein EYV96_15835 [Dyella terrae]TCI06126.1 hypothetical protein EZM97_34925 [Dyella soli]
MSNVPSGSPQTSFGHRISRAVKRLSPTGTVFAGVYLYLAGICLLNALHGGMGVAFGLQVISLPVSWILMSLSSPLDALMADSVVAMNAYNIVIPTLEITLCAIGYYWIGRKMEKTVFG